MVDRASPHCQKRAENLAAKKKDISFLFSSAFLNLGASRNASNSTPQQAGTTGEPLIGADVLHHSTSAPIKGVHPDRGNGLTPLRQRTLRGLKEREMAVARGTMAGISEYELAAQGRTRGGGTSEPQFQIVSDFEFTCFSTPCTPCNHIHTNRHARKYTHRHRHIGAYTSTTHLNRSS